MDFIVSSNASEVTTFIFCFCRDFFDLSSGGSLTVRPRYLLLASGLVLSGDIRRCLRIVPLRFRRPCFTINFRLVELDQNEAKVRARRVKGRSHHDTDGVIAFRMPGPLPHDLVTCSRSRRIGRPYRAIGELPM